MQFRFRTALVDLWELLGAELTNEHRAKLDSWVLHGLDALRAALEHSRNWHTPSSRVSNVVVLRG